MRNLLTCAMLVASPAFAAQVYKCKGPDGEVSFANIHRADNPAARQNNTCKRAGDVVVAGQGAEAPATAPRIAAEPRPA